MKKTATFLLLVIINYNLISQSKFSALMFGDYYYNVTRDDSVSKIGGALLKDKKDLNGFTYRRINLTYDYSYNSKISSRITLESDNESSITNSKLSFFVKDAYLKFDSVISNVSIQAGVIPTPIFSISEKWWGNRFLEKTITDLRRYASSRDIGLSITGNLFTKKISYLLMVGNNSGNKVENDRFKSIYSQIIYTPSDLLILTLTFSYHFAKKIVNIYDNTFPKERLINDTYLITFFMGYNNYKRLSAGIELFFNTYYNGLDLSNLNKFTNLYSYGGTFYLTLKTSNLTTLVERIDFYEPNSHSNFKYDRCVYNITGINFNITKNIIISPNVQCEFYDRLKSGHVLKPSVTPRITFYWKY